MLGCPLSSADRGCLKPGDIYSFGSYIPSTNPAHWNSSWSQMVLGVKRHDAWIMMVAGQLLAEHLACWLADAGTYLITHVPADRVRSHTANTTSEECTASRLATSVFTYLADRRAARFDSVLVQMRKKQKKQRRCSSVQERFDNVRGCYSVRPDAHVEKTRVIVVDDVTTTGATLQECIRVIKHAGAAGVIGIAMARTVKMCRR